MKVYAFHIGDTKVPYGQFYGGDEWLGWRGMWRFLTDKSHYIIVPIYAFLIDHPRAGPIMVDTGINWRMAHEHNQYYDHWLFRLSLDEDEYRLTREQELGTHLKRTGYWADEIETVILTHLHEDHLGEVQAFPRARFILTEEEWKARNLGIFRYREWSPSFSALDNPVEKVTYSSGPYYSFEKSQDLLGDGSIRLLPTPGHSRGHMSVLVQKGGYQLLLTGDALYTLRHLAVEQVRAIVLGKKQLEQLFDSIRRVQRLRDALPEMVIVPGHDHTRYLREYLDPFLADGVLSPEERQAIRDYEARLFEPGWRLALSALPRFLPPADGGNVGAVTEPEIADVGTVRS